MSSSESVSAQLSVRPPVARKSSTDGIARTKILLLGLRRAGKTSIQQVLFNNLLPKQTFYLDSTMRVVKHIYDTVIPLEIWDCPGNITPETLGAPLSQFTTLIFVIDIRDLYTQPIAKLVEFIIAAFHDNPDIHLEIFVHKAEKLQDDDKYENFKHINERVADRLADSSAEYDQLPLNFHLTSIYDHSLHEAFSKVLLKLITSLPFLEHLLNVFCANSQCTKAFLFDVHSRLYVATDASPVDSPTYNLCCDFLQTLNSFGPLYKSEAASANRAHKPEPVTPPPTAISSRSNSSASAMIDSSVPRRKPPKELFYPSAATVLQPHNTLTYHLITEHLALLALIPTAVCESKKGLLEYNVVFFREGVQEIVDAEHEARGGHTKS